ncbi:hypothetical protein SAY86_020727 [Trapa natans]|uniref:histidine kinase n=1 Tax=Trapa natans TaxID=22666 RepID=A0AAN7R7Z8_TRANT|nr:hypothetical protein SAY86_020727 [Trapa natans]
MSLVHVIGFGLKLGHLFWMVCCWLLSVISMNWFTNGEIMDSKMSFLRRKVPHRWWEKLSARISLIHFHYSQFVGSKRISKRWWKKLLYAWVLGSFIISLWIFFCMSSQASEKRKETLMSMCDERARMLQDQFNVSMNHVQVISILISTFHHGKNPSAIDQRTFAKYTERTSFERPLTSGVAYAVKVLHSEREQFEKQQGWTIKRMDTIEQKPFHKDDYEHEAIEPSPVAEEYAPVIFAQDTISHVVSLDMLSGKEDRENVLRARALGKGVLTAPFRLLKTNRLGVILTFPVYKMDLPANATENERIQVTSGYIGGVFHIQSLVEKLLQQLASKQTIDVTVLDTTNRSYPISMYDSTSHESDDSLEYVSFLNFGDPFRKHEMRCRFKEKAPWPLLEVATSTGFLIITLLVGHIFHAAVNRIAKVEDDCRKMMELKKRAEAADVAKSQFLATVSHEIRTPMNGVLGMLHMLMDTDLDVTQQDYVRTAQASGKALVSLINEVLDQAKIESGKLELEAVQFDLRAILDDVLSLFSGKSQEKGIELAVYISDRVPEKLVGDPGRFRQILTNLMGNSIKFTEKGHIFVTVHLVEEVKDSIDVETKLSPKNTLSGFPVAERHLSWSRFRSFSQEGHMVPSLSSISNPINLVISVEDTGEGIPLEAQPRIFTPFVQVGPSISRTHGGTGIGLSISKCLVSLMNGEIGFVSFPSRGSTFTFTAVFDGCSSSGDYGGPQINKPSNSSSEFHGMMALLVDPRPVRAKVSRYHVQRLGIHVKVVHDLNDGLASALNHGTMKIDMILMEEEVWNKEPRSLALFMKGFQAHGQGIPPKLFLLTKSFSSSKLGNGTLSVIQSSPAVITKPLRASMIAASLQRVMGSRSKANPHKAEISRLALQNLLQGRKILVVDDNDVNLKVAAFALKKYGADVVCENSGIKAITLLKPPHHFDACFMDIQMPIMDGFEATRRIRLAERSFGGNSGQRDGLGEARGKAANWHVPILAMTADVIHATHDECIKCGMDGYVSKPFEAEQLYQEVSRFFAS